MMILLSLSDTIHGVKDAAVSAASSHLIHAFIEQYSWIIFEVLIICAQCITFGYQTMAVRKKLFTKAFFEKNFPEIASQDLKSHIGVNGGYPDAGSGKFSQKLSVPEWLQLNNAIRVHYNYLEGLVPIVISMLISGLYFKRLTFVMGIAYIVGRQLYAIGYNAKGPHGRMIGALMLDVALITCLATSLLTTYHLGGGIDGLIRLFTSIAH